MLLSDAIALIDHPHLRAATPHAWADLGCGSGLFTQALSTFLAEGSVIHAIDKEKMNTLPDHFNKVTIQKMQLDFVKDALPFTSVNGLLMANSLHFVKDPLSFLTRAANHLHTSGSFLIVEYDTDRSNPWVPYPLSFHTLKKLFSKAGFTSAEKIHEHPSMYNSNTIYAAWIEK